MCKFYIACKSNKTVSVKDKCSLFQRPGEGDRTFQPHAKKKARQELPPQHNSRCVMSHAHGNVHTHAHEPDPVFIYDPLTWNIILAGHVPHGPVMRSGYWRPKGKLPLIGFHQG